ncbi:N-acetyl-alpha-D-glucosaminyl L-malate synthase BshA [Flavobacterium plurextorum]|uniref:N-acetyl-alpha-D-glucosaminyl L-malate synthase BshA n=1 Tax=Flavobacterium plurextorum TaxID=1114867 RepID=A0ABX4CR57_9FLAO|nr:MULTISPECIES: N-acetyl-alpha-D-glucosaminyl L-malate synthase BshA [Flavobacterium]OXB04086.1 N-acetyl-alpha-D-glucosaminyl L-malate synthase BshA [Flavobacterium plurextorum]PIF71198.1 N-acetyl-alpha-D-glucosaminyl L-malate synthase BshA [Flavobacterium sp. 2]RXM43163.1 N-acetyl-alpha-D-glucosaminyl L-malate synthase BshA [Flavobacterium sp. YO64]UUW08579.1 N-acetyl-alpha-D-glucosaminyl L-malate synthase BshA [Flavobacterium plurextorum]
MKIAIVCYPTFGGSGVVATELGLELARRGHEIHFITYSQPVRLALLNPNVHYHEVNVPEYPLFHYQPYELALSSKLVDMVKLYKIEVLHVHYAIPHAYAGYMAKQMLKNEGINLPMITTLHGTDITLVGNHPFYKPAVTFSINKSDYVTSVSQSLKDDTLKLFKIKNKIKVIPNFIELDKVKKDPTVPCHRYVMAKEDERIITHISNFRKVKRIPDIIKIFYNIQKVMPAKLMMVGDGPEKEKAEVLCMELGIYDKVIFFGNSNEIDKILCFTDLFLLPSETESFGLAALEAMACGVPVISSNSGGLPEVNFDGVSGYLSNVGNVEEMAANAIKILKDDETLNQFKLNALEVAKKFDIKNILPKYEALYQKAIDDYKE